MRNHSQPLIRLAFDPISQLEVSTLHWSVNGRSMADRTNMKVGRKYQEQEVMKVKAWTEK
jgi:hypothetical protein